MPLPSLRRRLAAIEGLRVFVRHPDYPPLTLPEIEAIARRVQFGQPLSGDELARLESQSPIIQGELMIHARPGRLVVKRYCGVDVSEI